MEAKDKEASLLAEFETERSAWTDKEAMLTAGFGEIEDMVDDFFPGHSVAANRAIEADREGRRAEGEAQFMERFLKKRRTSVQDENVDPSHEHNQNDGSVPPPSDGQIDASPHEQTDVPAPPSPHGQNDASTHEPSSANTTRNSSQVEEINWEEEIQFDPGKRRSIDEYHPNQRDMVRRKYLANDPCQPRTADFEVTEICGKDRRFVREWFDEFGSWLEYSESKRKAYCFCCFLFRPRKKKEAGYDAFVANGWSSWNKKYILKEHVGDINSAHNQAKRDCDALLKQKQHIYQGLPFRGHDESDESLNKGNFEEFHAYTAEQNPEVRKVVAHNAPGNNQLTSSKIQKDIVECFAKEILHSVLREIGNDVFSLLADESRDVAGKEQMAVETTSKYLKSAIDDLFAEYKLSFKQVRGQGYDGASNMRGEFNGLQSLIMRENSTSYYVHCFAHQLQLVVVAVVRKHKCIGNFFDMISVLLNVVSGSSKRKDMIQDKHKEQVCEALGCGLLKSGTGLNQELALQRPGDTRWSSHYKTLKSLIDMFRTVVKVLEYVEEEDRDDTNRRQACGLLVYFQSFDFVFYLQLMSTILIITNTLSLALQRKNQDIVNAINCVNSTKASLNDLRRNGWESVLHEAYVFCDKHAISKLQMEDQYVNPKKPRQKTGITNRHHYEVDCFNDVIDWLLQQLDNRFNEKNSELLVCSAALSPNESFHDFNLEHLMSLAKLYPKDFDDGELRDLRHHLHLYIADVRADDRFSGLSNIFERSFSAMRIVKTYLRNRLGDDTLKYELICYVEKSEMRKVTNDAAIRI
ncbi:uncharacterized protein [Aegilops tauschii subsp. strangulata]|uniref:uncharacterized protein n=1 Tax=Aegilops tauschii subsp. strangulata TaxID=200361 RepID=UPI001ABBE354